MLVRLLATVVACLSFKGLSLPEAAELRRTPFLLSGQPSLAVGLPRDGSRFSSVRHLGQPLCPARIEQAAHSSGQGQTVAEILAGNATGIPLIRETGGFFLFRFLAPKDGAYSFDMFGYFESLGLCADLSREWSDTTDCSSLLVPHYQHTMGEVCDYPEFTTKNIGTLELQGGEAVYIRFHGPDWEPFTGRNNVMPSLLISEVPHLEHDYTCRYEDFDATMHRSYCSCGEYILEPHDYSLSGNPFAQGNFCSLCGHSRLSPIIPSLL